MQQNSQRKWQNRAQLMIVTAFIISITFLLLATLLNLAIYAENQAARGLTVADQSAYETQTQMNNSLEKLIKQTNYQHITNNTSQQWTSVRRGAETIATIQKVSSAKEQDLVKTNIKNVTTGTRLIQDTDRNFTSAQNSTGWTVVSDVSNTRNVTQTITRDSLLTHSNSVDAFFLRNDFTDPFETHIQTSSGNWRVYIFNRSYNDSIYIHVLNPSGNTYETCSKVTDRTTINYSARTIGGDDCSALSFLNNVTSNYSIQYQNADEVEGQYHIHTSKPYSSFSSGQFHSPSTQTTPYKSASVYSVGYTHSFVSSRLNYHVETKIAPNELTGDSS